MKNVCKTIVLIMVLTIAGTSIISAQRGDRGMRGMRPDSISRSGDHMMKMQMAPDSVKRIQVNYKKCKVSQVNQIFTKYLVHYL